jgi:hypothetical protein
VGIRGGGGGGCHAGGVGGDGAVGGGGECRVAIWEEGRAGGGDGGSGRGREGKHVGASDHGCGCSVLLSLLLLGILLRARLFGLFPGLVPALISSLGAATDPRLVQLRCLHWEELCEYFIKVPLHAPASPVFGVTDKGTQQRLLIEGGTIVCVYIGARCECRGELRCVRGLPLLTCRGRLSVR